MLCAMVSACLTANLLIILISVFNIFKLKNKNDILLEKFLTFFVRVSIFYYYTFRFILNFVLILYPCVPFIYNTIIQKEFLPDRR